MILICVPALIRNARFKLPFLDPKLVFYVCDISVIMERVKVFVYFLILCLTTLLKLLQFYHIVFLPFDSLKLFQGLKCILPNAHIGNCFKFELLGVHKLFVRCYVDADILFVSHGNWWLQSS